MCKFSGHRKGISREENSMKTSTYEYDHENTRTSKTTSGVTTLFPNEYYNKVGATTTRHIYDNTGGLIASVEGNGIATTTYFIHPDHLGGTNVVTDASGEIGQLIDYYPYGSNRLDSGTDVSQREFIGEMYDEETDLSYLNARYYSGDRGQFNSQDPVFWEVGQTQDGNAILTNPQAQNSYSYAGDNPIVNKDPTGRIIDTLADIGFITYDVYKITQAYIRGESVKEHFAALGLDTAGALIPGVTGLGMMARVAGKADNIGDAARAVENVVDTVKIDPSEIRFTQNSISNKFSDGTSLVSVIDNLKSGKINPDAINPIR